MDRFGPTGKVSKKLAHLSRWTTFLGWTGPLGPEILVEWIAPKITYFIFFLSMRERAVPYKSCDQIGSRSERHAPIACGIYP